MVLWRAAQKVKALDKALVHELPKVCVFLKRLAKNVLSRVLLVNVFESAILIRDITFREI